jgi:isopentenyldiphosphate isomerase
VLLDIFDDKNEFIGVADKNVAHRFGLWHRVFTCLVLNRIARTVYLQKKTPAHHFFDRPDYLDISVGGHYESGEFIYDGVREIREELGIRVPYDHLKFIGIRQTAATIALNHIDCEFQYIHLLDAVITSENFCPEGDEVSGIIEVNLDDALDLVEGRKENAHATGIFISGGDKKVSNLVLSIEDFIPSYLESDHFYARLFIAAKRWIESPQSRQILW